MRSIQIIFSTTCLLFTFHQSQGQSVFGKWYSLDPNDQRETIIELYQKNDKLYGKVVALLQEEDKDKTCQKCPEEYRDQPLLGLEILRDFSDQGEYWADGTLLVPKTGRQYNCHIALDDTGRLVIRGFIGLTVLGRSTYWYRVKEE